MPETERPKTPGEILSEQYLKPMGITQQELADRLRITRVRLNEVLLCKRSITIDTAIRLARLFNTTAEYWMKLQFEYDLWDTLNRNQEEYNKILPVQGPGDGEP